MNEVSYLALLSLLVIAGRFIRRQLRVLLHSHIWDARQRIVIGGGAEVERLLEYAQSDGYHILGYVASAAEPNSHIPYLGNLDEIESILARYPVDGVGIALRSNETQLAKVIQACEQQGVSVELFLDGLAAHEVASTIHRGDNVSFILPAIPHRPFAIWLKRLTDIAISALTLVLLSPVFAVVAVAIKFENGGPVFFKQQRVGMRNRTFWMYKFRSMYVDAEQVRGQLLHLNEMSGPVFKLTHDPRVTRVGKFLRKTSIDELPQLFNVLLGNMSLVGPRPPLPTEVSNYDYAHRRRLSVRPGITCLWQISGRNNVDFEQWMNLDLYYIDNWSYLQDWRIMMLTIPAVMRREGAR